MAKDTYISMPVIRRLPRYYRFLYDLRENGVTRISSRELSRLMGLTASQIRQDFNCFGGFGQQGYGYVVDVLYTEIGHILGMDRLTDTVLLGVGNLGKAIVKHMDFSTRGFRLVGLFDDAPPLVEQLLRCGVRGFWNFSHYDIAFHHPEAIVENVHLGDSLMTLSYEMSSTEP